MEESRSDTANENGSCLGIDLVKVCQMGLLSELIEQYIALCGKENEVAAKTEAKPKRGTKKAFAEKKKRAKFPNVAGFCRYCGVGYGELERLAETFPYEYGALCSVFEDEALNSDVAVTLLGTYMKTRLGYGSKTAEKADGEEDDVPIAVFDHDIFEDGE